MDEAVSRLRLSEDGSEDEEEQEYVDLGFLQEPEHSWVLERQHFPCKAGGVPAWLDPVNVPQMKDACCEVCEEPLQFLLQVYAPLDERDDTFHRALFVFICTKMACLNVQQSEQAGANTDQKPRKSIKVFRSQLPRKNVFYSDEPPLSAKDLPLMTGVQLCNWCGTWRGEKLCGGCKRVRYCSRKHQTEHWRAEHSTSCKTMDTTSNADFRRYFSNRLWKEFELVLDEEGNEEESVTSVKNPLQLVPTKNSILEAELQDFEASKEKQCWAAFQTRIASAPSQVLRYCRSKSTKPLWMKLEGQPQVSDIRSCERCGGPRVFEFQLLPQLLYYFGVENEPESLDWGTIAVYSCAESCSGEGYVEEMAWVQL